MPSPNFLEQAPVPQPNCETRLRWTAIILAGQRPGVDPVAAACGQIYKALATVDGKAMLAHVAHALLASPSIERILVLAQEPQALMTGDLAWLGNEARVTSAVSGSGIATSIAKILGREAPWPVLVTTSDHPLLTPAMVEEFIAGAAGADLAAGLVERSVVMSAYPETRRTWLHFRGGAYSGANLFALRSDKVLAALRLWEDAEADRKQAFKLFLHFGAWLALRAITRSIGLEQAFARAGMKLGVVAKPVLLGEAEAAIDVDKVDDLTLAGMIMGERRLTLPSPTCRWTESCCALPNSKGQLTNATFCPQV